MSTRKRFEIVSKYLEGAEQCAIYATESAEKALCYANKNNDSDARNCPNIARDNAENAEKAAKYAKYELGRIRHLVAQYKADVEDGDTIANNAAAEAIITRALKQVEIAESHAFTARQRANEIIAQV